MPSATRTEIIRRVPAFLKIMRITTEPTLISQAASVELPQSVAAMWSFMWDPASSTRLSPEVEAGFTLPGSPSGVGEVQVFVHRSSAGRAIQALEVIELEPSRRAVTRSLGTDYPSYGILTVEPAGPNSCRLTQEFRLTLPTGTPVTTVRHARDQYERQLRTLTTRLAALAPHLGEEGESPPEAIADLEPSPEFIAERRRSSAGNVVQSIITTGLVAVVIAAAMLTPAALVLAGQFEAGGENCGTLLARSPRTDGFGNVLHDCGPAAHARLVDVIVWAAIGCVLAVAYGLRLRLRLRLRRH